MPSMDIQLSRTGHAAAPDADGASSRGSSVASHGPPCSSREGEGSKSSEGEFNEIGTTQDSDSPYVVGLTLTASKHEPPEPFGYDYEADHPPGLKEWESLSKREYCCSRIPISGHVSYDIRKTLNITTVIRTGWNNGAQLVVVDNCMVAKIFDPICYRHKNEYVGLNDVVIDADGDYTREAVAFQELQKSPAAQKVTPAFYGTWVIELDTILSKNGRMKKYTRRVPLILMEFIQGQCMRDIQPHLLSEEQRSTIIKRMLEAEVIISHAGVTHNDMASRNVMVIGFDSCKVVNTWDTLTVKLIDFNIATVRSHPRYRLRIYMTTFKDRYAKWLPRLHNPICRFNGGLFDIIGPEWLRHEDHADRHWLWEQYHDDERYIPVVWDPAKPSARPKYVDDDDSDDDWNNSSWDNSVDSGLGPDMEVGEKKEFSGRKDSGQAKD